MAKSTKGLTPADFFDLLHEDKVDAPAPLTLVGMVKKSAGKEASFQFAPGGNCTNWVTIPLELIEGVEVIRTITCKDHSHPLITLSLKSPKTPEGKVFFAILQGMKSSTGGTRPSVPTGTMAMSRGLGGRFGTLEPGHNCRTVCAPAVCPNPSGHGTIWCTECWTECTDVPEFSQFGF
jgi:hypothetical protein